MTINVRLIDGYWGKNILRNLKFYNINNIYCLDHLNYKNTKNLFYKMKNYFLKPIDVL